MDKKQKDKLTKTLVSLAILLLIWVVQRYVLANDETVKPVETSQTSSDEPIVSQAPGIDESSETVPTGTDYSLPALRKKSGEQILHKKAMTISYNKEYRIPNWVAYQLLSDDMDGNAQRERDFSEDMEVEAKYRVNTHDYSRSGYDRGHMAPAADFSGDPEAKKQTFIMTNICPQNHELNARSWNDLEQRTRLWAHAERGIFVVVGPIVTSSNPKTIGQHQVVVPDAFFRCLLSLRPGHEKAIGFIYQNTSETQLMSQTCCSVDEVEEITGLDFFAALDDKLEEKLESQFRFQDWRY